MRLWVAITTDNTIITPIIIDAHKPRAIKRLPSSSSVIANAKVTREQVRAKNKETLLQIIDNESLGEDQKQEAVESMVHITELAEKETAAESLLASKGFTDAVVSINEDSADGTHTVNYLRILCNYVPASEIQSVSVFPVQHQQ